MSEGRSVLLSEQYSKYVLFSILELILIASLPYIALIIVYPWSFVLRDYSTQSLYLLTTGDIGIA